MKSERKERLSFFLKFKYIFLKIYIIFMIIIRKKIKNASNQFLMVLNTKKHINLFSNKITLAYFLSVK